MTLCCQLVVVLKQLDVRILDNLTGDSINGHRGTQLWQILKTGYVASQLIRETGFL